MSSSVARNLKDRLEKMGARGLLLEGRRELSIRLRPCYWSAEGGRPLPFDLAIESRSPGTDVVDMLWVWHCIDFGYHLTTAEACEFSNRVATLRRSTQVHGTVATSGSIDGVATVMLRRLDIGIVRSDFVAVELVDPYSGCMRRDWDKAWPAEMTPLIKMFETSFAWSPTLARGDWSRFPRRGLLDTPTFMRKQLD